MATVHECLETGYSYCDVLQEAFDQKDRGAFEDWLELQRNWLLVGLRESFNGGEDSDYTEMSRVTVLKLLDESTKRRRARQEPKKKGQRKKGESR